MTRNVLYLVRHGEQARPDSGSPSGSGALSDIGREQARLLGRRLERLPFDAVHHGPAPRAAETATIIGRHLPGVPVRPCDLVADRTPLPSPAEADQVPARYAGLLDAVPADERDEGTEHLRAAVEHFGRVGDRERHDLVVTHNFVIGWFVRHVLDAPIWRWIGLNQANCGLTIVEWHSGRPPMLVSFNDVGHLPPRLRT